MDNTFQIIHNILFSKSCKDITDDELTLFVPYLTNRYASMYSSQLCEYIDVLLNNKNNLALDNRELYNLFYITIPKLKYKKIAYIKKQTDKNQSSKSKQELQDKIKCLSRNKELSIKEITNLIQLSQQIYE